MLESSENRLLEEKDDRLRRRTRGHRNLRRRVMSDHSKSQVTKISQRLRPKSVKISLSKTSVYEFSTSKRLYECDAPLSSAISSGSDQLTIATKYVHQGAEVTRIAPTNRGRATRNG